METVNTINTRKKVKDGYCCNGESKYCADWTEYNDTCEDFEERRGSDYEK